MNCKKAKQTGKPCENGYSREIVCLHYPQEKWCLRDCGTDCKWFEYAAADKDRRSPYGSIPAGGSWSQGCCGGKK